MHTSVKVFKIVIITTDQLSEHPLVPRCSDNWLPTVDRLRIDIINDDMKNGNGRQLQGCHG